MDAQTSTDVKAAILEYARRRFSDSSDWLKYASVVEEHCNLMLGADAAARFFRDPEFREVRDMIVQLALEHSCHRPTRMITVRLPRELHDALKSEANGRQTSLNRLCIAKLLTSIDATANRVPLTLNAAASRNI
ncbi:MAG: hypothetical protein H6822_33935 [Planctomycetaceae bacterium]|nr:hypothetical protein [Planctomycetales bacterium]MCB9927189.1 hypothetical protein [Planctomycetaceae bacterium]